jgi:hypothetical protein
MVGGSHEEVEEESDERCGDGVHTSVCDKVVERNERFTLIDVRFMSRVGSLQITIQRYCNALYVCLYRYIEVINVN